MRLAWVALLLVACSGGDDATDAGADGAVAPTDGMVDLAKAATDGPPQLGPDTFPSTAPWYQDYTSAGTSSDSGTIISHLSSWGTLNVDVSFNVMKADSSVARRAYTKNTSYFYSPDCDFAPVPVPMGGAIENYPLMGYSCGGGDCHLLVYQGTRLYELYVADIQGGMYDGNPFTGGCLAIWDLTQDVWQPGSSPYGRGEQCTSADAAGFPIAALMLTADDLNSGEIKHALRFTLPNSLIRASTYVHPATHGTGPPNGASGGSNTMPYGAHLRLKPGSYSSIGATGQIIVKALQKYGMYMADGGNLYISGTADLQNVNGFSSDMVSALNASDFEVLDSGAPIANMDNCNRTPITN